MSRTTFALATAVALATLLTPTVAVARTPEPALAVPADGAFDLTGHGYGHGRGMSQYGAEGAARQGLTAAQILAFYYPGTTVGSAQGRISVRIGADTSPDTVVAARSRLVVRVVGKPSQRWTLADLRGSAVRWRLKPLSTTRTALAYKAPGRGWARAKVLEGTPEFFAGGAPITLYVPGGSASYRGALRSAITTAGGRDRDTVNVLGMQNYLRGVVPREMPSGWSGAALQAQSVAARTYAAYERAHAPAGRPYQTCDSTSCQVYGGYAAETSSTDAAVAATKGQILVYAGRPAFTQFSSSSGGWTVQGTLPYQAARSDPYDGWTGNRVHTWTVNLPAAKIAAAWPAVGTLSGVRVLDRDGNGEWGGRVLTLRLTGTKGAVTVDGTDFRMRLGLRSTWFALG